VNIPGYWKGFYAYTNLRAQLNGIDEDAIKWLASQLVDEYREKGCLELTPKEALQLDDAVICRFYLAVGKNFTSERVISPVEAWQDSSWMYQSDFCYINVRATGEEIERTGRFIDAMKLIPVVRANSVLLAPFFDCALDNIYAMSSFRVIMEEVLDEDFLRYGISAGEQLLLLVDAIHSLGKAVGFDFEPHVSQFSRIVLEYPEHFRWIKLNDTKDGLKDGASIAEMLSPASQNELLVEIREAIDTVLLENGLTRVEDMFKGADFVRWVQQEITDTLISLGYWTLPAHTWNGAGLPGFHFYYYNEKYPDFKYLDRYGKDQHQYSSGIVTPYNFYSDLPVNSLPDPHNLPCKNTGAIDFFQSIIPELQRRYYFDFVRFLSMEHIFSSCLGNINDFSFEKPEKGFEFPDKVDFSEPSFFDLKHFSREDLKKFNIPLSDRPTPDIMAETIHIIKTLASHTGVMGEYTGFYSDSYRKLGFDLLMGDEFLRAMDSGYLQETLAPENHSHLIFPIDTHNSGHPHYWSMALSEVAGPEGMALRHFLSRFTRPGKYRRPKYEVIGSQDLSSGLFKATTECISIKWAGNKVYNRSYHSLENIYEIFRSLIYNSHTGPVHIYPEWGYWFLDREDGERERLLCVAGLEEEFRFTKFCRLTEKKLKKLAREVGFEETSRLEYIKDEFLPVSEFIEVTGNLGMKDNLDLILSRAEYLNKPCCIYPEYPSVMNIIINFREDYFFEDPLAYEIDVSYGAVRIAERINSYEIAIRHLERPGAKLFFIKEGS